MDHEQWLKLHDEWLELHNRAIAEHDEWLERHNRAIAEHDAMMAESDRKHDRMREEHERDNMAIRQMLRHAVQLSVREARNERRKRRELAEGLRNLQTTVDRFIDSLRRGGNGNQT
jgi:hypothetical protein